MALDRSGFRWPAPLVALGDRSFSLYLVQPFAIGLLRPFGWPQWLLAWAALLLLNVALGSASHRWIERPATARLKALLGAAFPGGARPVRAAAA